MGVQSEKELHTLIDILTVCFRKAVCSLSSLFELCRIIKTVSSAPSLSQQLRVKLTLLPMLAYGFWKLLEVESMESHPFCSEFSEIDKFFADWSYEDNNSQNGIIHIAWHLFRRIFASTAASSSGDTSPFRPAHSLTATANSTRINVAVDIHCIPGLLSTVMKILKGSSGESACREVLLMMMDACLYERSFLDDRQQSIKAFQIIAELCQGLDAVHAQCVLSDVLRGCLCLSFSVPLSIASQDQDFVVGVHGLALNPPHACHDTAEGTLFP